MKVILLICLFVTISHAQLMNTFTVYPDTIDKCLKRKNYKFCIPYETWSGMAPFGREPGMGWCCNMNNKNTINRCS